MITAFRIYKPKYAASAFTGEGARVYGGRFNSKGTAVVYLAGSVSLAALEMLVHLTSSGILESYSLNAVHFDEALVKDVSPHDLPPDWSANVPPVAAQRIGDAWVAGGDSAVLRVPSAVVPSESNYLLNPAHPDLAGVVIDRSVPFKFDPRLA